MLSKKVIKDIESLHQKKFRDEAGLFLAEGPKVVEELLQEFPEQVQQVYAVAGWKEETAKVTIVSEIELQRLSTLKTPNKAVAVVQQFPEKEPAGGFILYLDTIQDPGNLGTIIRTADWYNITQVVCSVGCADRYNPKVVQATMASVARVNVYYDREDNWLLTQDAPMYAAALDGSDLSGFSKITNGVLVIGNESKGIRPEFLQRADHRITIPRKGKAESLNAAVATGILLSHLTG